ncbi:hypothetical protein [Pseudomonas sichuanensis]|uniref:hypothetical protein n=1 Tax=Pseudomonas sichuanensis TaxID=2213015 RepID=UPI000DA6A5B5|nr:hypothetical protein [Pseudomonas sichuanensis]
MKIGKLLVAIGCAALLSACGSSEDKAKELIEISGADQQYGLLVEMATSGYASRYPMLEQEQVRSVIRDNVSQQDMKQAMIDVYADHFDEDELELMIQAQKRPNQAMQIILGSKDGRALALKVVEIQKTMMKDMQEAMADSDDSIVDALDDLKDRAKG